MHSPANMLEQIVRDKRGAVRQRKARMPETMLRRDLLPSERSLAAALSRPGNRYILEYKRASPSAGVINAALTADDVCRAYDGFADAVSVLTDEKYFAGSFNYLRRIRETLSVPVLCKDFILEPYQVYEARYHGADAILLMLSVLDDTQYMACADTARRLGLDILTEVHTRAEVRRARALDARIIGINNRDLKTLATDLAVTEALAGDIPEDRLVVTESGIGSRHDIRRLSPRVDGFLIGTSLTACTDVRAAVKRLLYGEIKICGITTTADARLAERLGARYLGLMCYHGSPRHVLPAAAEEIIHHVHGNYVGVFVDAPMTHMLDAARRLRLTAVQCHGTESTSMLAALREQLPAGCQVWKGLRYTDTSIESQIRRFDSLADRLLVDSLSRHVLGGSGACFDWRAIPRIQACMSDPATLILAGGITPENVCELEDFPDLALDICSGVESSAGVKSTVRLRRLFEGRRGFQHHTSSDTSTPERSAP